MTGSSGTARGEPLPAPAEVCLPPAAPSSTVDRHMPPKKAESATAEPQNAVEPPKYPNLEAFAEQANPEDVVALFAPLKESLGAVKGPRAQHAHKATKGVERTEELLHHLLQVREKLKAERGPGPVRGR
jgi:hypothetical protein